MTTFCFQPTQIPDPFPSLSGDTSRILHCKGWASRLPQDASIPVDLEALMENFDVFAFDGDDLKNDSFTKFLAVIVCRRFAQNRKTPTVLWAIKYNAEVEGLLTSWTEPQQLRCGDEITTISAPPITTVSSSSSAAIAGVSPTGTVQSNYVIIPLHYTCIEIPIPSVTDIDPDNDHFRYLGEQGLALTQAVNVATIGGGACVVAEYQSSLLLTRRVQWHVLPPLTRAKAKPLSSQPLSSSSLSQDGDRGVGGGGEEEIELLVDRCMLVDSDIEAQDRQRPAVDRRIVRHC